MKDIMKKLYNIFIPVCGIFIVLSFQGYKGVSSNAEYNVKSVDTTRSLEPYFVHAASSPKAPDAEGFLQRWLLLEPINKPNRSNTVFTDSYIRKTESGRTAGNAWRNPVRQ